MPVKKSTGAQTGFKDKDGNPILVHAYVADSNGSTYYINAYSQAVPTGEGVAVELERLSKDSELRVLSAKEVLEMHPAFKPEPKAKRAPRGSAKTARGKKPAAPAPAPAFAPAAASEPAPEVSPAPAHEAAQVPSPAAAPAPAPAEKPQDPSVRKEPNDVDQAEINAELEMLIQAIPDRLLAAELRRRGYVFAAVKPVIVHL